MVAHREILLVAVLVAISEAFTLRMSLPSSPQYRNTWNIRNTPISSSTSTSSNAVAIGCHEYDSMVMPSLKYRLGSALGEMKRRIRYQTKPQVEIIEDVSNFDSILKSTKHQFVAVFFHSPVCKACQAAAPHFYHLSQKYRDVKFLSVPLTPKNKHSLQNEFGVKKFPFGHIYHSQHGLLEEQLILRKLIPQFEERLQSLVTSSTGSRPLTVKEERGDEQLLLTEGCME